jgi:hypothetical protein
MKPVVLEFVGGYWGGKTLRTDSADLEEVLLAAACYETCHHGAMGDGCGGLSEYAVRFARNRGWPAANEGGWQADHRYSVIERRETENEIVVKLRQATIADSAVAPPVGLQPHDASPQHPGMPAGSEF